MVEAVELTNRGKAGYDECDSNRLWREMVRECKMFVKDEAKISSRVGVSSEELCIWERW